MNSFSRYKATNKPQIAEVKDEIYAQCKAKYNTFVTFVIQEHSHVTSKVNSTHPKNKVEEE